MTRSPSESAGMGRPLWAAAFALAAVAGAASLAGIVLGARWHLAAAAAAGGASLALLLILASLARRSRAAAITISRQEAGNQQLTAELIRTQADAGRRDDQVRAHLAARSAALSEAVDQLVQVRLPAVLSGAAAPPPVPGAAAGGDAQALCDRRGHLGNRPAPDAAQRAGEVPAPDGRPGMGSDGTAVIAVR